MPPISIQATLAAEKAGVMEMLKHRMRKGASGWFVEVDALLHVMNIGTRVPSLLV